MYEMRRRANRLEARRGGGTKRSHTEINLERNVCEEIRVVRSIESEHKEEREPGDERTRSARLKGSSVSCIRTGISRDGSECSFLSKTDANSRFRSAPLRSLTANVALASFLTFPRRKKRARRTDRRTDGRTDGEKTRTTYPSGN